jgi:hypothetical protein
MDKSVWRLEGASFPRQTVTYRIGLDDIRPLQPILYAIFLSLNDNIFSLSLCNTDA